MLFTRGCEVLKHRLVAMGFRWLRTMVGAVSGRDTQVSHSTVDVGIRCIDNFEPRPGLMNLPLLKRRIFFSVLLTC